ncbi:hypothetical protein FN846DRAFT_890001 [Sphaerosporella brunnea]|uniref:Uncharacterized protein n=1 Tax=Sphaerosporella brunnea TaxID=1250544 RepID=A0A5J5EYT5_9PEZI|nr:hypothetical protein FN846DRAFT_890001 [Sphaerosporella brunnea]
MSLSRNNPILQKALDQYSLAVQQLKFLLPLLPPSNRAQLPPHLSHRRNVHAVRRATAKIEGMVATIRAQLRGGNGGVIAKHEAAGKVSNHVVGNHAPEVSVSSLRRCNLYATSMVDPQLTFMKSLQKDSDGTGTLGDPVSSSASPSLTPIGPDYTGCKRDPQATNTGASKPASEDSDNTTSSLHVSRDPACWSADDFNLMVAITSHNRELVAGVCTIMTYLKRHGESWTDIEGFYALLLAYEGRLCGSRST